MLATEIADLCYDSEIDPDVFDFESVFKAYAGRSYHHLGHIDDMFDHLSRILWDYDCGAGSGALNTMENWIPVAWAILYHDIVQGGQEPELASAARLSQDLTGLVDLKTVNEAYRLILVTKNHLYQKDDVRAALICDADLAILGETPEKYREYAKAIRKEYASVDEDLYRQGRIEVLNSFLKRPFIYGIDKGREAVARTNIKEEIASLRSTPWYESDPPL